MPEIARRPRSGSFWLPRRIAETSVSPLAARDEVRRISGSSLWLMVPFLVVAIGGPLVESVPATVSLEGLVDSFHDDAYYYFEVAANIAAGRGSTFDGVNPTNGYHPLWMALLVPIWWLAPDRVDALALVKLLCSFCWAASVALVWLIGRRLGRSIEAALALAALLLWRHDWFSGMESAVMLPVLLAVVLTSLSSEVFFGGARRSLWSIGLVLALVPLARLDAIFFVGAFLLVLLLWRPGSMRSRFTDALVAGAPTAIVLGAYLAFNQLAFGSAVPVSGRAKSLGEGGLGTNVLRGYLESESVRLPFLEAVSVAWFWVFGVASAFAVLAYWRRRGAAPTRGSLFELEPMLLVLVLAKAGQLAYYALATTWPLGRWYHYYLPVLLVFSALIVLGQILDVLGDRARVAAPIAALAILLAAVHLVRAREWHQDYRPRSTENYKTYSVGLAEQLHRLTPPDAVFAMGDRAGSLSYLLDRPVVQTEGLVNSAAYLRALERGEVHDFLERQGVDYFVFSGGERPRSALRQVADREGCWTFEEPKFGRGPKYQAVVCDEDLVAFAELDHPGAMGGMYGVWRYRRELQDAAEGGR